MKKIELKDFLNFKFLSALQASPNGRYLAFVQSQCDFDANGYHSYLWIYDTQVKKSTRLTGTGREKSFLWLDDETLLFQGEQRNRLLAPSTCYYGVRVDGGEPLAAFTVPLWVESIKKLDTHRFVVQAKTTLSSPEDLPEEGASWAVLTELPFAENGVGYCSGIRHRLYLYDSNTQEVTPITAPGFQVRNDIAVSPDGKKIAYMGMDIDYMEVQKLGIYLYEIDTGETRQYLPQGRYKLRHLDFIGDKVLFTGADGSRYIWSQNAWFYTLDIKTGQEEIFFESFQMPINNWVGSDSRYGAGALHKVVGDTVYHVITQMESSQIVRIQKGGIETPITQKHGTVDCFDLVDNTVYMIAMRDMRLQELYAVDVLTGEETRLTAFNEEFHTTKTVTAPIPCNFKNDAGDLVQGWVIPPVGYQPGTRYPAILDIHGGPKTAYGDVYYHEMQLWASQGYFVLFCNPRGSDGRGDEFAFLMTRYGTVDYDDIMRFTDVVLDCYPDIDPTALGVTGGSYGGYMTNWIVGHTNRFAAAASQRSISNWITDEGTSDWSYMYSPCRFGGASARLRPEEAWASSPLKFADKANTPMLFIHAEEDFRCPLGEALQYYTNIINRGVETRMCLFKGENHELSRSGSPRNRVKRLEEITGWMDSHLKR